MVQIDFRQLDWNEELLFLDCYNEIENNNNNILIIL